MDPAVRDLFTKAALPRETNVYMFALDPKGELVHGFVALAGGRRNPSHFKDEMDKAAAKIKLPEVARSPEGSRLPDPKGGGVRLFIRAKGAAPVVEAVPMKREEWAALDWPAEPRDVSAEALKAWLIQLYPPAIRTADQSKPFTKLTGTLRLEPVAGTRTALLRGDVRVSKGEGESGFEGKLEAVLSYDADPPAVRRLRGVVEGAYVYAVRGNSRLDLSALVESRPD
jgi:hypothetical protein